ncbi:MAG: prepilin-type N-terminal cleavage/methylation domain-containing protein [Sharpea porci]
MKKKQGFTLIEIIVVTVILAILLAIAVPSTMHYINEADNAKYITASRTLAQNLKIALLKDYNSNQHDDYVIANTIKTYNKKASDNTQVVIIRLTFKSKTTTVNLLPISKYTNPIDPTTIALYTFYFGDPNVGDPQKMTISDYRNALLKTVKKYTYVYPNKKIEIHNA